MIDIKTKIHDRFSIEFKVGFVARRKMRKNDFTVGVWLFVPSSLDINPATYTKHDFYKDVKSNIRLITPHFLLRDIVGGEAVPFRKLTEAAGAMASDPTRTHIAAWEYHVKLFAAIVKSALRDETEYALSRPTAVETARLANRFAGTLREVIQGYYSLHEVINTPTAQVSDALRMFEYCGEFICKNGLRYAMKFISVIDRDGIGDVEHCRESIVRIVHEIQAICAERDYAPLKEGDGRTNASYIHRHRTLKRLVESQLFLRFPKRRDGVVAEQAWYSVAAGVAMLFATVIAWAFQRTFGNLTWPLFIALIISYMMKDRIKELMRFWFAHRVGTKYYDNKAKVSFDGKQIGWLKEGMDFIAQDKVPAEVTAIRSSGPLFEADPRVRNENVILYRKRVHIDREKMEEGVGYGFNGINDIFRLQVQSFLRMMDNPEEVIPYLDADGSVRSVVCPKEYHLHCVLQYNHAGETDYKHFRIVLRRDGIQSIREVD
jgi:hypothetical protein